jgi:hypothetical protein
MGPQFDPNDGAAGMSMAAVAYAVSGDEVSRRDSNCRISSDPARAPRPRPAHYLIITLERPAPSLRPARGGAHPRHERDDARARHRGIPIGGSEGGAGSRHAKAAFHSGRVAERHGCASCECHIEESAAKYMAHINRIEHEAHVAISR